MNARIGRHSLQRELTAWTEIVDQYLPWMETLAQPPDSFLRTSGRRHRRSCARVLCARFLRCGIASGAATPWRSARPWDRCTSGRDSGLARNAGPAAGSRWLDRAVAYGVHAGTRERGEHGSRPGELWPLPPARLAAGINMRFLYDSNRRLFGVGYAVGGPVEFSSHYDLLASECRLASLVAIAKGDVPVEHWYALGRPRVSLPGGAVLLSWSGTMFEYLMPLLFMRTFANSLLDHACREAVRQQIVYGRR